MIDFMYRFLSYEKKTKLFEDISFCTLEVLKIGMYLCQDLRLLYTSNLPIILKQGFKPVLFFSCSHTFHEGPNNLDSGAVKPVQNRVRKISLMPEILVCLTSSSL